MVDMNEIKYNKSGERLGICQMCKTNPATMGVYFGEKTIHTRTDLCADCYYKERHDSDSWVDLIDR